MVIPASPPSPLSLPAPHSCGERGNATCIFNILKHRRKILKNTGILKTQHSQPFVTQNLFTFPIVLPLLSMSSTIDLDHQTALHAQKIHHEPFDWGLPSKLKPSAFPIAQSIPENHFRFGHPLSEYLGIQHLAPVPLTQRFFVPHRNGEQQSVIQKFSTRQEVLPSLIGVGLVRRGVGGEAKSPHT